jgi:hypothetical protein
LNQFLLERDRIIKPIFKKIFFAVLSVLFGFLLAVTGVEITLRICGPDWLKLRMRDLNFKPGQIPTSFGTDLGWPTEYKDNVFYRFTPFRKFQILNYEWTILVNTDEYGGRVSSSESLEESSPLIPVFGDSMTFGLGVQDKETFVSLLSTPSAFHLLNLGVPGSCLSNHLDTIALRHGELSAPVCIFTMYVGNDFADIYHYCSAIKKSSNAATQTQAYDNSDLWVIRREQLNAFVYHNPILKQIYLIQFLRAKLLAVINHSLALHGKEMQEDPIFFVLNKKDSFFQSAEESLNQEFQRIVEYSKKYQFIPIVIIIPDKHQVDLKLLRTKAEYYGLNFDDLDPQLPNRFLKSKFDALGIRYIDTLPYFTNSKDMFYIRDNHLTPAGHKLVADHIYLELEGMIKASIGITVPSKPKK